MNREDLVRLINLLHEEMQQLTVDAGVSIEIYESVIQFDVDTPQIELEVLHTWLQIIFEGTYSKVKKTWNLHPRSRWRYYYQMGEELTEIRLLNKVRRDLYAEWKKPYYVNQHKRRAKVMSVQA